MAAFRQFAAVLLTFAVALPLLAQTPPAHRESAQQLVRDVIWNELHDRERFSHWEYLSDRTLAGQTVVREQVETTRGPIFRILERNGSLLDSAQRQQETRRIEDYIHDPSAVTRIRRDHQQDEARLASIMRMMPQAFLFHYQAPPDGDVVRLSFQPNPSFVPSGYEARIIHALAGTMTVNLRYKRMIDIHGVVEHSVDFGFGLLGHVDQGGTFEIHRCQVSPRHWKTDLVAVHVHGSIFMFKTVSKNEREARSDFHPVPEDLTLAQASLLLRRAALSPVVLAQISSDRASASSTGALSSESSAGSAR